MIGLLHVSSNVFVNVMSHQIIPKGGCRYKKNVMLFLLFLLSSSSQKVYKHYMTCISLSLSTRFDLTDNRRQGNGEKLRRKLHIFFYPNRFTTHHSFYTDKNDRAEESTLHNILIFFKDAIQVATIFLHL